MRITRITVSGIVALSIATAACLRGLCSGGACVRGLRGCATGEHCGGEGEH